MSPHRRCDSFQWPTHISTATRNSCNHIHLPSCDGWSLTSNAMDHDAWDGFGPYDHIPTLMEPLGTAIGKRLPDIFDQALVRAQSILCYPQTEIEKQFNSLCAFSPDNLHLTGRWRKYQTFYFVPRDGSLRLR